MDSVSDFLLNGIQGRVLESQIAPTGGAAPLAEDPSAVEKTDVIDSAKDTVDELLNDEAFYTLRLSTFFMVAYLVYCVAMFFAVRGFDFDIVYGFVRKLRSNQSAATTIQTLLIIFLVVIMLGPVLISVTWAVMLFANDKDIVNAVGVILMVLFSYTALLGVSQWYGAQWDLSRLSKVFLAIAGICGYFFALTVTVFPKTYSFSGATATLFSANFLPACYLVHKKTEWKDINLRHLFFRIAARLAKLKPGSNKDDKASQEEEQNAFKAILAENDESIKKDFKYQVIASAIAYIVPLAIYAAVLLIYQEDEGKGLAVVTPLFIVFSDIVILSLRDLHVTTIEMRQGSFIYTTTYQSLHLLLVRCVLCFQRKYWLIMQSAIFVASSFAVGYDFSQALFEASESVNDEHTDIIEMYRVCPLLQAKVKTQCPEIRCDFEKKETEKSWFYLFRTQVFAVIFTLVFVAINVIASNEPDYLTSEKITFVNTIGQWVFGEFALFVGAILVVFILWFRTFKLYKYSLNWKVVVLYLGVQVVSTACGALFYYANDVKIYEVLAALVILPITAVSFFGFFGLWSSNDYNCYERSFQQTQNFNALKENKNLTITERMSKVDWKPKSKKDCLSVTLIAVNVLSLAIYTVGTAVLIEPAYLGLTIGTWIAILEASFLFMIKYREANFKFTFPVAALAIFLFLLFVGWILVIALTLFKDDDQPMIIKQACVVIAVVYVLVMVATMLNFQLKMNGGQLKKLTISFWILLAATTILFLVIGVGLILMYDRPILGAVWLAAGLYLVLSSFLKKRFTFKIILNVVYAVLFAIAGVAVMVTGKSQQADLLGITTLFCGLFLLTFGSFLQVYIRNKEKKKTSILIHSAQVFPILEYNMQARTMKTINAEGILLFTFEFVVLLWGFCATVIAENEYRYIPVSVMAVSLSLTFIYIIDSNIGAFTVDYMAFRQATFLFFASCLVTATQNKQSWRNQERGKKQMAVTGADDEEGSSNDNSLFGPVYLKELRAADQWKKALNDHKKDVGFFGYFLATQNTHSDFDNESAAPESDTSLTPMANRDDLENSTTSTLVPEVDSKLETIVRSFTTGGEGEGSEEDKKIDSFVELVFNSRTEVFHDTKFWAFLNGYVNLKMQSLQEKQLSVLQSTIELYQNSKKGEQVTRDGGDAAKDEDESADSEEHVSVSSFLKTLKSDTAMMVDFSNFLASEMISEGNKRRRTTVRDRGDDDADEDEAVDESQIEPEENVPGPSDGQAALEQFMIINKKKFEEQKKEFDLIKFQEEQKALLDNLMKEQQMGMMERIAESRKRDEERNRQRAIEEERNRIAQENAERRKKVEMDQIQEVAQDEDEKLLQKRGDDEISAQQSRGGTFEDPEFEREKAIGSLKKRYVMVRAKDMESTRDGGLKAQNEKTTIFADGVSAGDIRQGSLGDCYLLSAMSVIAHSRPELLKKIFHPQSRQIRDDGLYTIMMYQGRSPVVLTVDDRFLCNDRSMRHAFVSLFADQNGQRELWPLLIEKAYAKMYGNYSIIEGGVVDAALADLTNGAPQSFQFSDEKVKEMFNTGELWDKLKFWEEKGYLMGAGSPSGVDTDTSDLGIVQGHAYSILDVFEIDGNRLIQLRNPWGDATEWKGAWSDHSRKWTEKRKRIVYNRMEAKATDLAELGKEDGVFWMTLSDFFMNFSQLFLCRFFDQEYKEIFFESEWNVAKNTAGGCTNNTTCGQNPQMKLHIESATGDPVEVFIAMSLRADVGQGKKKKFGIGFEIYKMQGKAVVDRRIPAPKYENDGGYCVTNSVQFDGEMAPTTPDSPYTLLMTTFDAAIEAGFRLTIWYKHSQGKVTVDKF